MLFFKRFCFSKHLCCFSKHLNKGNMKERKDALAAVRLLCMELKLVCGPCDTIGLVLFGSLFLLVRSYTSVGFRPAVLIF